MLHSPSLGNCQERRTGALLIVYSCSITCYIITSPDHSPISKTRDRSSYPQCLDLWHVYQRQAECRAIFPEFTNKNAVKFQGPSLTPLIIMNIMRRNIRVFVAEAVFSTHFPIPPCNRTPDFWLGTGQCKTKGGFLSLLCSQVKPGDSVLANRI